MPVKTYRWFEITVVGFLYCLSISFLMLRILNISELSFLANTEEYSVYLIPIVLASAYSIGWIADRFLEVIAPFIPRKLKNIAIGDKFEPSITGGPRPRTVRVFHLGSEKLVQLLDENWRAMAMFRSLIIALPIVLITFTIWIITTDYSIILWISIDIIGVIIYLFLIPAHRKQYIIYHELMEDALKVVDTNINNSG